MSVYQAIVMGTSAGGSAALEQLLLLLPATYPLPIIIVQHLHPLQKGSMLIHYSRQCSLTIKEAEEKEAIKRGAVYFAPANYHLLIEDDRTFSLSIDEKVCYARPSIDVLFGSAVDAYGAHLVGIILSGANSDGAQGLRLIQENGGLTIVQDPRSAEAPYMPQAALEATPVDHVLPLEDIGKVLLQVGERAVDVPSWEESR